MRKIDLDEKYIKAIINIILKYLKKNDFKLYIFGSRAKNTAKVKSDIDLLIDCNGNKIDGFIYSQIVNDFEYSIIPFFIDLVDLNNISTAFKANISNSLIEIDISREDKSDPNAQKFLSIPEVKEAMDELTFLSHDKEFREEYEARQKLLNDEYAALAIAEQLGEERGLEKGEAIGIEKGIAEGAIAKARETAVKLLSRGMSVEDISDITGLTIDEIKTLSTSNE